MKIYKSDGSYVENVEDIAFGWNIDEIRFIEAFPEHEDTNRNIISSTRKHNVTLLKELGSEIKIQEPSSVVDFQLNSENPTDKIENIDSKVPPKTQVASLINPCCAESRMLLSVVHHAKYKNLKKDVHNLGDLTGSSRLKFLIDNMGDDIEGDIRQAINNYYESKEDNVLSLMMELILADTNSDLDNITDCPRKFELNNTKNGRDSVDGSPSGSKSDIENRSEILQKIGLGDVIDRNIERMCEETGDICTKITEIKKSFQDDARRVNILIAKAQTLEKNLRETKFMEDLLHLLNGDLHKVTKKKSPFRVFLHPSDQGEANLIV